MLYIFLYLYNQRVLNNPMTWLRLLAAKESYLCNSQWILSFGRICEIITIHKIRNTCVFADKDCW